MCLIFLDVLLLKWIFYVTVAGGEKINPVVLHNVNQNTNDRNALSQTKHDWFATQTIIKCI